MNEGIELSTNQIGVFDPIQELERDYLGRHQFARRVLRRLSSPDCSPTIGLYGGWGVGKTSILNLINVLNELEKCPIFEKPKLEYIDVWPYEVAGNLALPILIQTRKLMGEIPAAGYSKSWRRILGVLSQATADIALRRVLNLELSDLKGYVDNLKDVSPDQINIRDLETLVDDIRGARNAYYELIQLASKANQNRRLVFLIDNLDRCSPENVVRLLESVKNFLYAPNSVWVFAMDSGVIASYIDRKYDGTRMDGNGYLDKIIPEQYHIPPISGNDMGKLERFLGAVRPARRSGLPIINLHRVPQMPEVLIPRRLLKTAHKFYEAYTSDSPLGSPASPDLIFSLILLYNTWPAFYERFSSETSDHVRGILANFVAEEQRTCIPIPIPQIFIDNRSLTHYVIQCFIKDKDLETSYQLLVASMIWLREVGLP
jgi:hypothetical protein